MDELDWGANTGAQREKFPHPGCTGVPASKHWSLWLGLEPDGDYERRYHGEDCCHPVGPRPCEKLAIGCRCEVLSLTGASGGPQLTKQWSVDTAGWWHTEDSHGLCDCTGPRPVASWVQEPDPYGAQFSLWGAWCCHWDSQVNGREQGGREWPR